MAFVSYIDDSALGNTIPEGGVYVRSGYWTQAGGDTGGDIRTGFKNTYVLIPIPHVTGAPCYVNEDRTKVMPGNVTIVTPAGVNGKWVAWGS